MINLEKFEEDTLTGASNLDVQGSESYETVYYDREQYGLYMDKAYYLGDNPFILKMPWQPA
ncbi:MAG TPA: hypothetical protein DCR93_13870 [Cytophagales bacterium]|nr:hypothetical protein [Cytophagales bacterium]HAP60527.1 hypothetical protein [Cytophagales bacterium]